jgi:hypothetical protein
MFNCLKSDDLTALSFGLRELGFKRDTQCTYNATLKRFRVTVVAVKKQ